MPDFPAVIDLASLDGTNGFRIDGIDPGDFSGLSVASAGDVNGDGFDDTIIAAYVAGPYSTDETYVVFGHSGGFSASVDLAGLDGANGFRLDGSGWSVASAGDINGDGFDDVVVGALGEFATSYLVFGHAGAFSASLNLAALNGVNGFRIDATDILDETGWSVASTGDINGDGFDDFIIGAPYADPGGRLSAGECYVVFGHAGVFAASLQLDALNGSNGFRIDGIDAGDLSGRSVAAAGDVNGDGFADLIVGAPLGEPGIETNAGQSYVVFGHAGGFAASLDLAALDGLNGFRIDGIDIQDRSGFSAASAGDLNGDGFADLIIGAYGGDPNGDSSAGESYVVFGHAGTFAASLDLARLNGVDGFRLDGVDPGDQAGFSVASAGDVNGDGFDDLIIGAYGGDPHGNSLAGESYVVFGHAGRFTSSLDLGALDGSNGFRIEGIDANDFSSRSVASAGDVNGDGFADLVIGARSADPGGDSYAGESYVVFGHAPLDSVTRIGSAIGQTIHGGAGDDLLDGRDGDDTLLGGGGDDDLRGGEGNDAVQGGLGDDIVSGGSGNDTLDGGVGYDVLTGGSGDDTLISASGADAIDGGSGNDVLNGGGQSDTLYGREGTDRLSGGAGADTMSGGLDNDVYQVNDVRDVALELAGEGADRVNSYLASYTLAANIENLTGMLDSGQTLVGNAQANRVTGGAGVDRIEAGAGRDTLTGGAGADWFIFRAGDVGATRSTADVIADFAHAPGERMRVRELDADTTVAGDQNFAFIGSGAFTGAAGQLHYAQAGGMTYVEGDTDGDGVADFAIALTGTIDLVASDFIL